MLMDDYCFACGKDNPIGLHLQFDFEGDKIIAHTTLSTNYQSYAGVVHGGIVTTMLDEAMGKFIILKYNEQTMTGKLSIRYRHPTPTEKPLTISAWKESQMRNIITMKSTVCTEDGTITAEATAL